MTKRRQNPVTCAAVAASLTIAAAGCSSSVTAGRTTQPTPVEIPTGTIKSAVTTSGTTSVPTPTGRTPASGTCATLCAIGDDGMQYRITSTRRFTGLNGISIDAIGFSLIDPTPIGHDFDATGGGFSAVLSSGGVVQLENELSSAGAGDPGCYTNPVVYPGSNDPNIVHVDANSTFAFPKQICMAVRPGDKITEIEFADQDASGSADIRLPNPL